jgi:hypothetical protein
MFDENEPETETNTTIAGSTVRIRGEEIGTCITSE